MDITTAFNILMYFEGGGKLTNIKGDKGGLTKYGIAHASHPDVDIANLTEAQARTIYENEYWNPSGCANLKPELHYIHFDTAVNCGVRAAIKLLQAAAGVETDGIMGPDTIQASQKVSVEYYAAMRIAYYKALVGKDSSQAKFLQGWTNRVNAIIALYKKGALV